MSDWKKTYFQKWFLPLIFLVLLVLPAIEATFGIWEFERKGENRTFKDKLILHIARLNDFPKDCEEYVNDNFPFRPPMLDAYHRIKVTVFRNSPHPNTVLIGNNGWYFVTAMEKVMAEGRMNFSEQQLDAAAEEWHHRKDYLDSLGIEVYWVIAPYKYNVYYDQLPYNFYYEGNRRATQLKNRLDAEFPDLIIDPVPALLEAKDSIDVFHKLDIHWNYHGGEIASRLLLKQLRKDFSNKEIPSPPNYQWTDTVYHGGYLYNALGIEDLNEITQEMCCADARSEYIVKYDFSPPEDFPYPTDYSHTFQNKTIENGIRVLVIRDSFAGQMIPFLKESFSESTYIYDNWKYELHEDMIERIKPDAVIYVGFETHAATFFKHRLQ